MPPVTRKQGAKRGFGAHFGIFVALLILAAGCDGASGPTAPASSTSSASRSASATTTASPTPSRASSPPHTLPAAPVAVRTTHAAATPAAAYTPPPPPPTTQAPQAPQPAQTTAQAQSCYPLTDGGNCYKPGEYCRDDDHGTSGIDASGNPIECEDNDGWRWEPA
jgi:hypothetical protein